ncbi:hypothetical protein CSPAE12_03558 [Colletotrichum incanum]|nr:hypothetical protein CSPAE12_03558 [Colletotrichum incanum]
MCEMETVKHVCTHRSVTKILCDDALYTVGKDFEACKNLVKTASDSLDYCKPSCIYRKWRKRWVCHKCNGPNQRTPRCAIQGCGHRVCGKCKPLTCPKTESKRKFQYNARKQIKWIETAKTVSWLKRRDAQSRPRIPVYGPSVGDWI